MNNYKFIPGPELSVSTRQKVRVAMFAEAPFVFYRDTHIVPHADLPGKLNISVKTLVASAGALSLGEFEQ
jgi:hypothetical protein